MITWQKKFSRCRLYQSIVGLLGIALKPNLVIDGDPDSGATTYPGVLSGCKEYLQSNGFSDIYVMEGSWVGDSTDRAMKTCCYDRVCQKYSVPFFDLKKEKTRTVQTALRPMEITCRALDTDFLIDLPVLKGHCQTLMTCALKNLKGCLPDREIRMFLSDGLIKPILLTLLILMACTFSTFSLHI